METFDICKDPRIWAGLNNPWVAQNRADVLVFSVPGAAGENDLSGAPAAIRESSRGVPPTTESFESFSKINVLDLGNVGGESAEEIFYSTERMAYDAVRQSKFFVALSGRHGSSIPLHRGVNRALGENFGIIHIGARFALCDSVGGDNYADACVMRRAMELPYVGVGGLFFLGVHSIEMDEMRIFYDNSIRMLTAHEIFTKGIQPCLHIVAEKMCTFNYIYITVDLDCLDPPFGAGAPQPGGMCVRELLDVLRGLFDLQVVGMDILGAAVNRKTSIHMARKVVTECIGHHCRENGLLDTYKKKKAMEPITFEEPEDDQEGDLNV